MVSGWDLVVSLVVERAAAVDDMPVVLGRLRVELLDLDIADVRLIPTTDAPDGSKGLSANATALGVRFGPTALKTVVARIHAWVARSGHSIEISIDGDTLKLTHPTRAQQDELVEAWLARHR
jgi:hypothetical protein